MELNSEPFRFFNEIAAIKPTIHVKILNLGCFLKIRKTLISHFDITRAIGLHLVISYNLNPIIISACLSEIDHKADVTLQWPFAKVRNLLLQ